MKHYNNKVKINEDYMEIDNHQKYIYNNELILPSLVNIEKLKQKP